ncbi:MAG: phage integrase N-terminal SAM-like domain-containing protein [Spirochaetia bacterium]|nr:phage integrase N-terminal SAM-like domain-containing protein [Spirochaetia bacterium]
MTIHLRLARYRERIVQAYVSNIRIALREMGKNPVDLTETDILQFLNDLFERGLSGPTIISYFSALKYLLTKVLKLKWPVESFRFEFSGKAGVHSQRQGGR